MKKLTTFFFGWLLLFCVIIIALWISTPPEAATGLTDTTYPTLQKSGQTVVTSSIVKWLSYLYGIGIIGLFSFGVFMGANKTNSTIKSKIYRALSVGVLLYFLVYTAMVFSWWDYTATNSMDYFLGLPKPTAWMFALMLIPIVISSVYSYQFDHWIYTKEDEQKFKAILAKRKGKHSK